MALAVFGACAFTIATAEAQTEPPTIEITGVPAYGSTELLRGRASGIAPVDYRVATYLFLEGLGWWVKPSFAQPCTTIQPDGTFEVDVTTGGVDPLAHRYAACLVPAAESCPAASGTELLPSSLQGRACDLVWRTPYTLAFSGYNWVERHSPYRGGPDANCFETSRASLDGQGNLHLTLGAGASSCGSEVWLARSLGFGEYRLHTIGRVDTLDSNAVFGAFTWDPDAPVHREMDLELSRWGVPSDPNAQFVLQPWTSSGNRRRFTLELTDVQSELTFLMNWMPGVLTMALFHGRHFGTPPESDLIRREVFTGGVPSPGSERLRMNLYRRCGSGCAISQDQEVVVTHFGFVPAPQDYFTVSPCRLLDTRNPAGRSGGPALPAGADRRLRLSGRCGMPAVAKSLSLNLTVTEPTTAGHLVLYPAGSAPPLTSSLNYSAGQTRANNAIVRLGDEGELAVRAGQETGSAHVVVDVNGYFSDLAPH